MNSFEFRISEDQLSSLLQLYPNLGKNSDVGKIALSVVQAYFCEQYPNAIIVPGTNGADLAVEYNGKVDRFEVKGTVDDSIAWSKLKVSSKDCYDSLVAGMTLIRVTSVGKAKMTLHFMEFGKDFTLEPEIRFAVKQIKKSKG